MCLNLVGEREVKGGEWSLENYLSRAKFLSCCLASSTVICALQSWSFYTVLSRSLEFFFQSTDLFVVVSFYNLNEGLTTSTFLPCTSLKSLKSRSCNLKSHKYLQLEKKSASLASVSSPPRVFMWWENLLRRRDPDEYNWNVKCESPDEFFWRLVSWWAGTKSNKQRIGA